MLRTGEGNIGAVYAGHRVISAVYAGARLVWQAVSSCFGAGFWQGGKPWKGTDGWKTYKKQ